MSYILDALKKADAEREQGAVPGLHSQPLAPAPGDEDDDEPRGRTLPIVWLGAGVALCLIAVLSWMLLTREAPEVNTVAMQQGAVDQRPSPSPSPGIQGGQAPMPPTTPTSQDGAMQPPDLQSGAQVMTRPDAPAATQPMQPGMQGTRPAGSDTPRQPSGTTPQPPTSATSAEPSRQGAGTTMSSGGTQGASPGTASGQPPATSAVSRNGGAPASQTSPPQPLGGTTTGQRVPTFNELPDDVRREIPQLTIGGAMYSEIPSQRMLIVNSQVFREGDQPYQGLMLEEIRLKSAVFKYRGYRYSVNY